MDPFTVRLSVRRYVPPSVMVRVLSVPLDWLFQRAPRSVSPSASAAMPSSDWLSPGVASDGAGSDEAASSGEPSAAGACWLLVGASALSELAGSEVALSGSCEGVPDVLSRVPSAGVALVSSVLSVALAPWLPSWLLAMPWDSAETAQAALAGVRPRHNESATASVACGRPVSFGHDSSAAL